MSTRSTNSPMAIARLRQEKVLAFLEKHPTEMFTSEAVWRDLWRYGTQPQIESAIRTLKERGRVEVAFRSTGGTQRNKYRVKPAQTAEVTHGGAPNAEEPAPCGSAELEQ